MPEYRVTWQIDIDAENPKAAAEQGHKIMLDPDSLATVFEVYDENEKETVVDLLGWI